MNLLFLFQTSTNALIPRESERPAEMNFLNLQLNQRDNDRDSFANLVTSKSHAAEKKINSYINEEAHRIEQRARLNFHPTPSGPIQG